MRQIATRCLALSSLGLTKILIRNLWNIVNRQNLSGIPVLETRPTMGWMFDYRLVDFFRKGKKVKGTVTRKKRKTLKRLYIQGESKGLVPCSDWGNIMSYQV